MNRQSPWPICTLVISLLFIGHAFSIDGIGDMPEVLVTAPRYEYEDAAWSGLMDEVVVAAQRPANEDPAWSGLMDTVVATATRYEGDEIITADASTLTKMNQAHSGMKEEHTVRPLTRLVFVYGVLFVVALITLIWSMVAFR